MRRVIFGPPIAGFCLFDRVSGAPLAPEILGIEARHLTGWIEGWTELRLSYPEDQREIQLRQARYVLGPQEWKHLREETANRVHLAYRCTKTGRTYEPEAQHIRSVDGKLRRVGFWKDRNDADPLPDPRDLVDVGWDPERLPRIASYLRNGLPQRKWAGVSWCRFQCGIVGLGTADYSDGTWLWPEGLVHYVEVHHVRLPAEFVAYMEALNFEPPADLAPFQLPHEAESLDFWLGWNRTQRP